MAKKRTYERIAGSLTVYYNGRLFIKDRELKHPDETVTIPVLELKQIIKDVVADTKEGLWG